MILGFTFSLPHNYTLLYSAFCRHEPIGVWLVMPIRQMCLLFSVSDLTVTDSILLCSLPTHSPQESEFQETASDRSDGRETEDGGLSGMKNRILLLFSLHSLLHLQLFHAGVVGHRFENGKTSGWSCPLLMEKQLWCLCGEEHICEKNYSACEGMIEFTQSCPQCVNESLWENFCSIMSLFMSDYGDFSLSVCSK